MNNNYILVRGACSIADALGGNARSRLKLLDMSTNYAQNEGGLALVSALGSNNTIEQFYLKNNSLTDAVGEEMASLLKKNCVLQRVGFELNTIKHKYLMEID